SHSYETATTATCTLSLHDALPILNEHATPAGRAAVGLGLGLVNAPAEDPVRDLRPRVQRVLDRFLAEQRRLLVDVDPDLDPLVEDRKSTRLNSSHVKSSYSVVCLK